MTRVALAVSAILAMGASSALAQEAQDGTTAQSTPSVATVTLDFSSEIKTTFYSDGSVYEEGFNPTKLRSIATKPSRQRP
jgi:hypothetical protein